MKYIRCEDKIMIYDGVDEEWYIKNKGYRFANAIEELCDEFVCIGNGDYDTSGDKNIYDELTERMIDTYKNIYGAIWIKGEYEEPILKSVAKMNEKGELELL